MNDYRPYTLAEVREIGEYLHRKVMRLERRRRGRIGYLIFRVRIALESVL